MLPGDTDKECIPLCLLLNKLPGIQTIESCCGHRRDSFKIWFRCELAAQLLPIISCLDGFPGQLIVGYSNVYNIVHFLLEIESIPRAVLYRLNLEELLRSKDLLSKEAHDVPSSD